MKITKRIFSLVLAIVTLVSVVSISAEALTVKVEDRDFGYMVPVNNKGTKVVSKVKLYGNYDYINFYINAKQHYVDFFFYEIYSDKKLKNCVYSDYFSNSDDGVYNVSAKIKLKGKFSSKTYYVVTYAATSYPSENKMIVDESSLCQFEMVVDRSPSYEQKIVPLKSTSNTSSGPKITWSKISGTSKYYVYRRKIGSSKMEKVGSVSGKKSSFVDEAAKKKDGKYIYTVKGIAKNGDASRYLYNGLTCLYAEAPVINTATVKADNKIYLEWKKTASDAKYYIYRKEQGGDWKRVTAHYANYYTDTNVKNGKTYSYRVKSIIDHDDYGYAKSAYSNTIESISFLKAPVMNELEFKESSIGVSWNLVEGAAGYSILRKPLDSDEKWTVLATVSGDETYFEDTTVSFDEAYLYTVRSEGDGFSGSYSAGKEYFTLAEPEFTVDADKDGVRVEWKKVPYATSYRVFEQNEDGTWSLKEKTKKLYYEFKPYTYYNKKLTVCACRTGDYFSTYNTEGEAVAYFPEIIHTVKEMDTYTQFTWNGTGADEYRVYRKLKDAEDSAYDLFYTTNTPGFESHNPEQDVAYTYQVRGVYGDLEQDKNIYSKTHIRYSPETCIKSFNAYKEVVVFNRKYKSSDEKTVEYNFELEKTEKFKNSLVKFYYWGKSYDGEGWGGTSKYYYTPDYEDSYDLIKPARFCCVVSTNSGNSTPLGVNVVYVPEETCEAPVVTLTPTSKGLKMTWDAVDDAVEYDVAVYFSKRSDYKKTFKADGSKTYTINFTDVSYDYNIYLIITAVHENGNKTKRMIDDYDLYPKPKLLTAGPDYSKKAIEVLWTASGYEGCFAVLRKAEGESKWTCISKKYYDYKVCAMNNGKEYTGFIYTDKKAEKGVKYTYTVRIYDPKTKEYVSYFNKTGVSAKR